METFISTLNIVLPTLYSLAWADYALLFFRNDHFAELTAPWLLRIAGVVHAAHLLLRAVYYAHFPVATVFEAFSVLAFSVLVIYTLIESPTGVRTTGFFIVGLVFTFQLISSAFITPPSRISPVLVNPTFVLHASTAVLGYSGMAISAIYACLYLMLFYDIKHHRFGLIYKQLPSLEILAGFTSRAATLGFVFLSVATVLGLALMRQVYGSEWEWDPKLTITLLAWIIYGVSTAGHKLLGWSPRRVAFASLAGFGVILFSLVAVNLFFTSFHDFL